MKTLGKEVLFLPIGEGNPRNGEGSFLRLKDGSILFSYTEYYGDNYADHATARISACISTDEGESWGKPFVLIEKDADAENYMSSSLVRLPDGNLGVFYLRNTVTKEGKVSCVPFFCSSADEGKTFSAPIAVFARDGFYCGVNDSAIVTRGGRVILAASMCNNPNCEYHVEGEPAPYIGHDLHFAYSDDSGKTWHEDMPVVASPYNDPVGMQEPGIYEYENGDLWVYARTGYGFQYEARSTDGGKTFSTPRPNFFFTSPEAPMRVKRLGDYTLAVFNPNAYQPMRKATELWNTPKRTPLLCAVSTDDGRSFDTTDYVSANGAYRGFRDRLFLIEDDESESYCYPEMIEVEGGFLVGYYHSASTPMCLAATKIKKITWTELNAALGIS
ncbi:MAG: exo-alpha-sialidase [Clostridia bacterium]|nr:exo-alpha-sialidase [Clostridia bacterium]